MWECEWHETSLSKYREDVKTLEKEERNKSFFFWIQFIFFSLLNLVLFSI